MTLSCHPSTTHPRRAAMAGLGCLWGAVAMTALVPALAAADSARAFPAGAHRTVGAAADRWHTEFEDEGDYSETWYFLAHTDGGGLFIASVSLTNLGLRTFDAVVDAHYYGPDGQRYAAHAEYRRSDVVSAASGLDVTIGPNRLWREGGRYQLRIDEGDVAAELRLEPALLAHQDGDGRVHFGDGARGEFLAIGLSVPRARASGTLRAGDYAAALDGQGYHGHSWATVKLPTVLDGWSALWLMHPELTLVLHMQTLKEGPGPGAIWSGACGDSQARVATARGFTLEATAWEADAASGYTVPSAWRLRGACGGYDVTGTLQRHRLLDSLDVLAVLSWPVRVLVQAIYGRPFTMRYLVGYELTVVDPQGSERRLRGLAPLEASYYVQPRRP